ncbi:DUF432 domain-containing protein [Ningiella sp. W23]|uniref:DUF432 domain-containing protein n=1 Tax=Ningiella sp. W23 TaxID=3023715 RepID=UPI003756AE60
MPLTNSKVSKDSPSWWGEHHFELNELKTWRFRERYFSIKRTENEWTVSNKETQKEEECVIQLDSKPQDNSDSNQQEFLQGVSNQRFMLGKTKPSLFIEPSLADRAMIARPSTALNVLPGESVTFFVSSPLWFTIYLSQEETPLSDLPFWRPSDSWFGPSTMQGDLCYAKFTDAKTEFAQLDRRENRALTRVTITNEQDTTLAVQRINLPVPKLKLYHDSDKQFWTDDVNILQQMEHNQAVSSVKHTPPLPATDYVLVSESRELSKKSSLFTTIKSLIA